LFKNEKLQIKNWFIIMHIPVLLKETIEYLNVKPNTNFIDATFGEGGHSLEILKNNGPRGKVLGIEVDKDLYKKTKQREIPRLILVNDSYVNLKKIVQERKFKPISGIVFDLGMCSWHIDESRRGFSFLKNEPLDMRFDVNNSLTAFEIINFWPSDEIEEIIRKYGEERYAKKISEAIREARKKERISSTLQLVNLLKRVLPRNYENHRIHFATRTFQALRIAVNHELENIEKGIREGIEILNPQGRIVVISFHSLEDRIVKNIFKDFEKRGIIKILTKKPIIPSSEEIKQNYRAHSAKMRVAQKLII
jgi:16S rRNA (cytosine1402-N4)-methyltransferase